MSSYYNQGVQVIVGNGQNFPGTPRISLIPFIQNAYDKGLLNFTVLPPGSISLAEIQDISTAKILGRSTAGSGVIEQISIGTGLSLSGGILSSTATAAPGGSDTQIQYNNAGAFAGSANLVTTTSNMLDIQGSGATSATNALRVRNSSGTQLLSVRNDGNVAYTNASVTSSSANDGILGITGFTHTANSGSTNALWALNIDGTQVFNTTNQTSGGLRIKLSNNATASQYNTPLYIESNAAADAVNFIKNTSSTGGSSIRLISGSAETSMTLIQSPNSNPSSISEGNGITIRTASTSSSLGVRSNALTLTNSTTSGNPQSVNCTFFIMDKRIGVGQYAPNTPNATLDIKGEGATSSTNALYIRNSANTNFLTVRDDGFVNILTNTEVSKPSVLLSGTGYSGGTSTTTKPTFLIEPTGTTSTGWSTSGTKLGVNAESGFTGLLMDLELNGVTQFSVSNGGSLNIKGGISAPTGAITSGSDIVSGGYFGVTSKSWIRSATNGNWTLYNNATTDFGLLQFGGTTSSYPALKRNSTGLDVRLADDSGYAAIQTLYDRFGSGSPESVVTAPVGAVYHRTDGGAGTSFYVKESGTGSTGWVAK